MKSQNLYNIIYSDNRSFRWKRHFLFWTAVFFYHLLRIGIMMPALNWKSFLSMLELAIVWGILINMIFSYSIVYFLLPAYFIKKKYVQFTLGLVLLYALIQVLVLVHGFIIAGGSIFEGIGYNKLMKLSRFVRPGFIRGFGNPPLICCLLLALKTLKNWHLEQLKTESLARENANAELQLLKAQIHPHFLFNTLNNIYSFSLSQSPQAGMLVKKLSGMLNYMIHECEEKMVPLEKELQLLQDYMGLEKVRYGKRLDMQVEINGECENKGIAPLLMIPFVENSLKHGTSQMLRHPWIKLEVTIFEKQLFFRLSNSKPSLVLPKGESQGIGLMNAKKRLQLLYPGKHQLDVSSTEETFAIFMQIMLEEKAVGETDGPGMSNDKALVYAG